MRLTKKIFGLFFFLFFSAWTCNVFATPIDLNTFSALLPTKIDISPDGSMAEFSEDSIISPIDLSYDEYTVAADAAVFSFDYALDVQPGNSDYFDFYFDDLAAPVFSIGGPGGSSAGTVNLNISSYAGSNVDIIFAFSADFFTDGGLNSTLLISNVDVAARQVSEPPTILLMLVSLVGLIKLHKNKNP